MEERREARKAETATLTEARALAIKTLRRVYLHRNEAHHGGQLRHERPEPHPGGKGPSGLDRPGREKPRTLTQRPHTRFVASSGSQEGGSPLLSSP